MSSGSGMAVGSGIMVGAGAMVGAAVGVACGAQALIAKIATINRTTGVTSFIFFSPFDIMYIVCISLNQS